MWPAKIARPPTDKVYFSKQIPMFNYRNMEISILQIDRDSIITLMNALSYLMNALSYLFNVRHLKHRYLHVGTESLKDSIVGWHSQLIDHQPSCGQQDDQL